LADGIQLIVGLGNPDAEHLSTRHNAGFWLVDALAAEQGLRFKHEAKFHGEVCKLTVGGQICWLLKPFTYMNRSGQSAGAIATFYKIPPGQILVVHDELDLPPGTVRLKRGGGHGGHNGLKSLISSLGSNDFLRLRLGIGHPGERDAVVHFVLHAPSRDEREKIEGRFPEILLAMPSIIAGDHDKVMNRLHSQNV